MKKFFLIAAILACFCAAGITLYAATRVKPSNNIIEKELSIGNFHELSSAQVNVEYTVGPAGQAVLSAPDNIINDIIVECRQGKLKVSLRNGINVTSRLNATLKVSSPAISEIKAVLSSRVLVKSNLNVTDDLDLEASTSGSIVIPEANIIGDVEFEAQTSGAIKIDSLSVSGDAELDTSTSGSIKIAKVQLTNGRTEIDASTSGAVKIEAGHISFADLTATTSGSIKVVADIDGGEAMASTSGSIKANTANFGTIKSSTGGSIRQVQ